MHEIWCYYNSDFLGGHWPKLNNNYILLFQTFTFLFRFTCFLFNKRFLTWFRSKWIGDLKRGTFPLCFFFLIRVHNSRICARFNLYIYLSKEIQTHHLIQDSNLFFFLISLLSGGRSFLFIKKISERYVCIFK